jgi:hypothetical protein
LKTFQALVGLLVLASAPAAAAALYHGFDITNLDIPRSQLLPGGPPRDGIPALTDPAFVTASRASFLKDDDRVLGVAYNGAAKAYPLLIMNWHEIVNDHFSGVPVAVTYCPLCYTGMAFKAEFEGRRQTFGVSGLLYNSDVVLYDRQTESLWSQLMERAISGPRRGQRLEPVPVFNTTWGDWRRRHPETVVLSTSTGYKRDYRRDPYVGYAQSADLMFPVEFRSKGHHPKQPVLGVVIDGQAKAYPHSELARAGAAVEDQLGGHRIRVEFDEASASAAAYAENGELLPAVTAYWFAWYAFNPKTEVYRAPRGRD